MPSVHHSLPRPRYAALLLALSALPAMSTASCSDDPATPAPGGDEGAGAEGGQGDPGSAAGQGAGEPSGAPGAGGGDSGQALGGTTSEGEGGQASEPAAGAGAGGGAPFDSVSLAFAGVDGYVALGQTSDLLGLEPTSHTISIWVKHSGEPASGEGIVDFNTSGSFGMGADIIWSTEDPTPAIAFYAPGGSRLAASVPDPGVWHHVAAVLALEESENQAKLYLDGQLADQGAAGGGDVAPAGAAEAGRYYGMNDFALHGLLDELAIWTVALDADAISAIYNDGKPTDLTQDSGDYAASDSLVAFYRFGDGDSSPSSLNDSAGGNAATASGDVELSHDVP